ncbi:hypothetical protein L0Z16_03545 [Burkholderia multivorans]|jgi:hypothetical protein|uniref:hypothetical protein n=1 Tax=Burkholderia multivorans TaxID=87883 RepID=UPI000D0088D4|nr:hypothetical protein [Burkholderia multivorans]MBU9420042.1 hypothetical protein [Burkholderia multivorans]MCL4664466.1 hypothetical protein [Burkholderia multivorans]MCO1355860.1 hypothetical protein [Burkholderia multivorans]MCO1415956.1 hypothetical protein [Burkholderia multivorans]MCO1449898.1 hypothetical protein [Burkholderia multivorans]
MTTSNEQLLHELDSFRFGVLAALTALKASIQDSPGFNQTALEDCVSYFLASPPSSGDREAFESPLRALLADRNDLLKAVLRRQ